MTALALVLTVAVVIIPPLLQLTAVLILHNASRGNPIVALLERLRVAQFGFLGSTIISLLAINGVLDRPVPIHPPLSTIIVAAALLLIAAPAGVFAWLYLSGRFGDEE